jgi:hypothetical protein
MVPLKMMRMSDLGEEERKMMTTKGIEEAQIRQELKDAQASGDKERMEKAWEAYMLLWKQKGLIR